MRSDRADAAVIGDDAAALAAGRKTPDSTDWPWWRGPRRDGIADPNQNPPLSWSATENIVWKAAIPGRGHGSPTVVGDQVVLATADEKSEVQSVVCYDRATGEPRWATAVHEGGLSTDGNKRASQASSTVGCDGDRFFITFLNRGAVHATALSRKGEQLWQEKISDYVVYQGYGSSPTVYGGLVIVTSDNKNGGILCALRSESGEEVWRVERPKLPNYPSAILLDAAGRTQLFLTGCDLVSSFDPLTGKKLWEVPGATTECVTSTVTDGTHIFTTGGYPKNHVSAVLADGSGEVAWSNGVRVYVPSMLVRDGYLYAVTDAGIATCWESATGDESWKSRLGGTFYASPVLVGERIYATNEAGETFVFDANPKAFKQVAKSQLGEEAYATPVFCGSRVYMRVASFNEETRTETLYCIADGA
jgi:outer membrane protein assembly factor BamB